MQLYSYAIAIPNCKLHYCIIYIMYIYLHIHVYAWLNLKHIEYVYVNRIILMQIKWWHPITQISHIEYFLR